MNLFVTEDGTIINLDEISFIKQVSGVFKVQFSEDISVNISGEDMKEISYIAEPALRPSLVEKKPVKKGKKK